MIMIIHRTSRDVARCRRKYGEAWTRYEKAVPYLFIPVSHEHIMFVCKHLLTALQYVI